MSSDPVTMPAFRQARSTEPTCSQASAFDTSKPETRSSSFTSKPSDRSFATIAFPIPPAAPVTSAVMLRARAEDGQKRDGSWDEDDLSCGLARFDETVRLGRLFEWVLGADDRPHRSTLPEAQDVLGGPL